MSASLYCDGIQDISITRGVVRIDYFALSPTAKGADGQAAAEFQQRIIMSPEAFLQAYSAMDTIVKQLMDRGLVTRRGEGANGGAGDGEVNSPNF